MSSSTASRAKTFRSWLLIDSSPRLKVSILLAFAILYAVTFKPITERYGAITAPMAAITVMLAGWFFGLKAGLLISFMSILLNAALYKYTLPNGWELWLETSWLGNLRVIVIGAITGYLHNVLHESAGVEAELRSRERYLTLLKMATSDILNPKIPDDRYYYLVTRLVNLFVADYGYFFCWDEKQEQTMLIASTLPMEEKFSSAVLKPGESAAMKSILQTERTLVIDDVSNPPDTINTTFFKDLSNPIRSLLIIPIIAKENKLGVVIIAYSTLRQFTAEEINQSEQSGQQVALALWTVQQEVEIQKRLKESDTLAKIAISLSETERIGLPNVLDLIVISAKELIPSAEQAVIHLINHEQQTLTPAAVAGYPDSIEGKNKMPLGKGVAGQVITSGQTINIADISTDPRFIKLDVPPKFRSLMVAPVFSGEQKLGTISVQSNLTNAFTQHEIKLLSALGTQAAIAIENTNLLENTQQALNETNALYRINQGLVASLNADSALNDAVTLLQKSFQYYYVQFFLYEPETGDLVLHAGSGEIGIKLKEKGYRLHAGGGIIGHTAETGSPFFTNHVDDVVFFVRNPLILNTRSELAVPVKIGDQILGVLDVQQVPPAVLAQHDIQLVSAVADQLAIALQKANLYKELQISLQQEKAIRNQLMQNERLAVMGRLLASVSHELNNPLQAIQNALFLLKEEKGISAQGQQDLNIVLAESEHMANMIERLRATYRPTQVEDFRPTQVNDIIEDVYALISPHLRHNQIAFEFHPEPELPAIPALSDQIRQVVINLVMNAVEAMPSGGNLTVSTELLEDTNEILCTVSDTGTGISHAILPNIFEAFVTNKQKGTGLGLTITYDIVLKHGGRITAENDPNRGSIFRVWLPTRNREIE